MKIVVGIATAGRRDILSETLIEIGRQTRLPDRLIVAPAKPQDCDISIRLPVPLEVIAAPVGLCAQRNAILDEANEADVVVFFDDDFFPDSGFLAALEKEFCARPMAAIITGKVVADDILGPGLSGEEARAILRTQVGQRGPVGAMSAVYKCYGCNMALNMALVRKSRARFDEGLPLYAWLEDEDFSRAIAMEGEILKSNALLGVHLGTKSGRNSGVKLGYSQIANPIYLWRKGTFPMRRAVAPIFRNVISNLVKCLHPEPWIDRKGRLRGNIIAFTDLAKGKMIPTRILEIE